MTYFRCLDCLKGTDGNVATNSKGEKEGFWGFDHIGQVCDHLELERPKTGGWRAML